MRLLLTVANLAVSAALLAGCSSASRLASPLPATTNTYGSSLLDLSGLSGVSPMVTMANWAQPGHDATHGGYNSHETKLGRSNVANLKLGFDFKTGNGIAASVVESNKIAYAVSTDGHLYALDAAKGTKKWSYPSGYGTWPQGVAVSGTRAFVTCQIDSGHAGLCALNAATGKLLWTWAIYDDPMSNAVDSQPYTGPAVSGNTVVLGESDTASFAHVGYIVALNASTGKQIWRDGNCGNAGGNDCNYLGIATPAIQGAAVYYGSPVVVSGQLINSVCAVSLNNGSSLWCTTVNDPNPAISVKGSLVYANTFASSTETLYALNAASGSITWSQVLGSGNADLTPAVDGTAVYVSGAKNLYAFNAKNGKRLWEMVGGSVTGTNSGPSVANGVVYASCSGICAFSTANGKLLWSSQPRVTSSTSSAPAIVNGTVYGVCTFQEACSFHL